MRPFSPSGRWTAWIAVAALALTLHAGSARAGAMPGLEATAGATTAISGTPDGGGWSVSLSPMWSLEDGYSFGVMLFADDMGTIFGPLRDPNDGVDLGTTEQGHTYLLGAAWRFDRQWGSIRGLLPYVSGTWGVYRIADDHLGHVERRISSLGFSIAGGVQRMVNDRHALGASIRYHRLFNDRIGRYVGWSVDWSFQ